MLSTKRRFDIVLMFTLLDVCCNLSFQAFEKHLYVGEYYLRQFPIPA